MSFMTDYATGLAVIPVCMTVLWIVSLRLKDSSIVDIFRGTGFAIAAAAGGWWTVFAPVLMTLLLRVSGVALLEQTLETRSRYKEYAARTNAFFPWFPRKGSH